MSKLNLLTEDLITLNEAVKEIPTHPHLSTVWRWHKRGINGIKLETIKIGSNILTTKQAITRFFAATQ
ncbi:DUF1580 domain-containing protein [Novipirellula rosea]|uniref:DUF1580 domain-containing protein n=1 Tax=Novipirellula rosea TaxID=1031540 RepID=A0ABP8NGL9_9BACT